MIKFKKYHPLNSVPIWKTEYKNCTIETGGDKSYVFIRNDNDYDFLVVNGMDEFELTTENGVTNDWSEVEWSELTKAIAALPEEEEGK